MNTFSRTIPFFLPSSSVYTCISGLQQSPLELHRSLPRDSSPGANAYIPRSPVEDAERFTRSLVTSAGLNSSPSRFLRFCIHIHRLRLRCSQAERDIVGRTRFLAALIGPFDIPHFPAKFSLTKLRWKISAPSTNLICRVSDSAPYRQSDDFSPGVKDREKERERTLVLWLIQRIIRFFSREKNGTRIMVLRLDSPSWELN